LRGCAYVSRGQVREELLDLTFAELRGVALAMMDHVAPDPGYVCLLGAGTELPGANRFAHLRQQLRCSCRGLRTWSCFVHGSSAKAADRVRINPGRCDCWTGRRGT